MRAASTGHFVTQVPLKTISAALHPARPSVPGVQVVSGHSMHHRNYTTRPSRLEPH